MTLYVNCCPRGASRTARLAKALLRQLGDYEELRLYETGLQPLNEAALAKRDRLLTSGSFDDPMLACARQFAAADTIVIAAPYWDMSFPSLLKVYLENIYTIGLVTCYDENGKPKGLCCAKKLYYVTTAGGAFDGRFGYEYLKTLAQRIFGIPEVELIVAELLDIVGYDAEQIMRETMARYGLRPPVLG